MQALCDLSCVTNHLFQENITKLEFTFLFPLLIIFKRWFLRNPYEFNLKINPCFLNSIPIRLEITHSRIPFIFCLYLDWILRSAFRENIWRGGFYPENDSFFKWRFFNIKYCSIIFYFFILLFLFTYYRHGFLCEVKTAGIFSHALLHKYLQLILQKSDIFVRETQSFLKNRVVQFSGMAASGNLIVSWNLIGYLSFVVDKKYRFGNVFVNLHVNTE